MTTCPTCGQAVRVHQSSEGTGCFVPDPSEEKIRAAFEAAVPPSQRQRLEDGSYLYGMVRMEWLQFNRGYQAGWKERGGE